MSRLLTRKEALSLSAHVLVWQFVLLTVGLCASVAFIVITRGQSGDEFLLVCLGFMTLLQGVAPVVTSRACGNSLHGAFVRLNYAWLIVAAAAGPWTGPLATLAWEESSWAPAHRGPLPIPYLEISVITTVLSTIGIILFRARCTRLDGEETTV